MQRTRAWRRHQRKRIRKKRIRQAKNWYVDWSCVTDKRWVGGMIDTPNPCNCWMCENPRKRGEKTLQELKALQQYYEGLEDLLND